MRPLDTLLSVMEWPADPALKEKIDADLEVARSEMEPWHFENPLPCLGCEDICDECSPRLTGLWKSMP